LVEQAVDVARGGLVTGLAAVAKDLVHLLEDLLPRRDSDADADHQDGATGADVLNELRGDRVLGHPKSPPSCYYVGFRFVAHRTPCALQKASEMDGRDRRFFGGAAARPGRAV